MWHSGGTMSRALASQLSVPVALCPVQLLAHVPGEAAADGLKYLGDPDNAPDSWIQPGPALAVVATWRTN